MGDANAKLTLSDSEFPQWPASGLGGLPDPGGGRRVQAIAVDAQSRTSSRFASVIWIRGDDASPIRAGPAGRAL